VGVVQEVVWQENVLITAVGERSVDAKFKPLIVTEAPPIVAAFGNNAKVTAGASKLRMLRTVPTEVDTVTGMCKRRSLA
jgi:hypothetical protein